jgi:hypothetical protein
MSALTIVRLFGVLLALYMASAGAASPLLDLSVPATTAEYGEMVLQPMGEDSLLVLPEDQTQGQCLLPAQELDSEWDDFELCAEEDDPTSCD